MQRKTGIRDVLPSIRGVIIKRDMQVNESIFTDLRKIASSFRRVFKVMEWDLDDKYDPWDYKTRNSRFISCLENGKVGRLLYETEERTQCPMTNDYKPYAFITKKSPEDRGETAFFYKKPCTCQFLCCCRPNIRVFDTEYRDDFDISDDSDSDGIIRP